MRRWYRPSARTRWPSVAWMEPNVPGVESSSCSSDSSRQRSISRSDAQQWWPTIVRRWSGATIGPLDLDLGFVTDPQSGSVEQLPAEAAAENAAAGRHRVRAELGSVQRAPHSHPLQPAQNDRHLAGDVPD